MLTGALHHVIKRPIFQLGVRMRTKASFGIAVFLCSLAWVAFAQQAARPVAPVPKSVSMIFRETFKGRAPGAPQQVPLTPQGITSANLELKLYGPGAPPAPDHESGLALNNEE